MLVPPTPETDNISGFHVSPVALKPFGHTYLHEMAYPKDCRSFWGYYVLPENNKAIVCSMNVVKKNVIAHHFICTTQCR